MPDANFALMGIGRTLSIWSMAKFNLGEFR